MKLCIFFNWMIPLSHMLKLMEWRLHCPPEGLAYQGLHLFPCLNFLLGTLLSYGFGLCPPSGRLIFQLHGCQLDFSLRNFLIFKYLFYGFQQIHKVISMKTVSRQWDLSINVQISFTIFVMSWLLIVLCIAYHHAYLANGRDSCRYRLVLFTIIRRWPPRFLMRELLHYFLQFLFQHSKPSIYWIKWL